MYIHDVYLYICIYIYVYASDIERKSVLTRSSTYSVNVLQNDDKLIYVQTYMEMSVQK